MFFWNCHAFHLFGFTCLGVVVLPCHGVVCVFSFLRGFTKRPRSCHWRSCCEAALLRSLSQCLLYSWSRKGDSLRTTSNIAEREVRPQRRFSPKHLKYTNVHSYLETNKCKCFEFVLVVLNIYIYFLIEYGHEAQSSVLWIQIALLAAPGDDDDDCDGYCCARQKI